MKITNICPDIPDNWKGDLSATAKILNISLKTLIKYAKLGRRNGGIDWIIGINGRKQFLGKEIKRFWRCY